MEGLSHRAGSSGRLSSIRTYYIMALVTCVLAVVAAARPLAVRKQADKSEMVIAATKIAEEALDEMSKRPETIADLPIRDLSRQIFFREVTAVSPAEDGTARVAVRVSWTTPYGPGSVTMKRIIRYQDPGQQQITAARLP